MNKELAENPGGQLERLLEEREELISKFIVDRHNLNGLGVQIQQLEKEIGELKNGR